LNVLFVALGSAGDVFPFIGLGQNLQALGHQVTLLTNSHFEGLIGRAGLEFVELSTEADYQAITNDPMLWSPIHGIRSVARWLILRNMRRTFAIVRQRNRPGETVIAAPLTAFGARIAQERLGIRLLTVSLQPSALRSSLEPLIVKTLPLSRGRPSWNRLLYRLADRAVFNPLVGEETNGFRAELGPIVGSIWNWAFSPLRILGPFPEWFGPRVADWPSSVRLCQLPLYDAGDQAPLAPEVATFLERGGRRPMSSLPARPCGIRESFSRRPSRDAACWVPGRCWCRPIGTRFRKGCPLPSSGSFDPVWPLVSPGGRHHPPRRNRHDGPGAHGRSAAAHRADGFRPAR
jgi:rhamnosyltransferase subunit B